MFRKWIWALAVLSVVFSCVREKAIEEPATPEEERFAEYDPVVRFGLETYMGNNPSTKTTYAGDDKTVLVLDEATAKKVRYERINWNVDAPEDVVRIIGENDFTKANKKYADYKAKRIPGRTGVSTTNEDVADTDPVSPGEEFYWTQDKDSRYFYGLYPSPDATGSTLSFNYATDLNTSAHELKVYGVIPSNQSSYTIKDVGDVGTLGSRGTREYLPDMTNAYMYAASVVPAADKGYKKVPLRFKPLFSAVKLIITARGDAAGDNNPLTATSYETERYRLKKVELRTDINENDVYGPEDRTPVANTNGTPLSGKFTAKFSAEVNAATGVGTTGNFSLEGSPTETGKRLAIDIAEGDRVCLNNDTLKLTFLALPVDQKFMTIDYTFEYLTDSTLDPNDPSSWTPDPSNPFKIREIRRTLALQDRKKIFANDPDSWYELEKAHKLYVRSSVPAIEYIFKVEAQSLFPRTWKAGSKLAKDDGSPTSVDPAIFLAEDFYSVVSYRDSSGVLQPLKWKVTGYSDTGAPGTFSTTRPGWLALRGEDGSYDPDKDNGMFYDPLQPTHPEYGTSSNGITLGVDPWAEAWGYGSHMDDGKKKYNPNGVFCGYEGFTENHTYVFHNAGAKHLGRARTFEWEDPAHYSYCDLDGYYYYPEKDENGNTHPRANEAYAYDLSHHDIYGNLYPSGPDRNGKKGALPYNTANCYVVSSPGWYRIPAVYGNGFKNGLDNTSAYRGDGGENRLGDFLDHTDSPIKSPWISEKYNITSVEVLWQDAKDVANAETFSPRQKDQEPFYWEDPDNPGCGYIYFYVNQVSSANAVIAAKVGGVIVWSWHIWGVPEPGTNLAPVEIQPNILFGNNGDSGTAPTNRPESPYTITDAFVYTDGNKTWVWKKTDLGQGEEDKPLVDYQKTYVEFTQYWRGKPIATRVVCFAQSGVFDDKGLVYTPTYQWGRKDPLRGDEAALTGFEIEPVGANTVGSSIQKPATLFYGPSTGAWHTGRYDNLWNGNLNYFTKYFTGGFDVTGAYDGRRRNTPVRKTIYDPCPPGYVVPNLFAFTAFNPRGLNQTRVRVKNVAFHYDYDNADPTLRYYDFATDYNGSITTRRDVSAAAKAAGKYVRFYVRGRRFGDNPRTDGTEPGVKDQIDWGHYWLAEPASASDYSNAEGKPQWGYGSAFSFSNRENTGQGSRIFAVAGTGNNQAKWQRTHGLYVRPMLEP